jgi:hypothetical protein
MKTDNTEKNTKKPYTKPTVESRTLKLGVYGEYGGGNTGPSAPPRGGRGGRRGR